MHSVVYDMIAKVFNTYSFTSTANVGKSPETPTGAAEGTEAKTTALEEQMQGVKNSVRKLVLSVCGMFDVENFAHVFNM